jgi:hypothetical protein
MYFCCLRSSGFAIKAFTVYVERVFTHPVSDLLNHNVLILNFANLVSINILVSVTLCSQHNPWKEASAVYLHLERAVECCEGIDNSRRLTVTDAHECLRLHCFLRDLSSLTQAVGRMYPHFIGVHI